MPGADDTPDQPDDNQGQHQITGPDMDAEEIVSSESVPTGTVVDVFICLLSKSMVGLASSERDALRL
ncbi:hypothetical protein [uncultured Thiocystis sp.]|jgi:hypothetical protein|uniref:hypothetical protein n=1 Tax=uncultured Thiocystis sp. TaxID=1202134 RepID=UPI0025F5A9E7|nr:hypothetical protein [uncultured Thiocystis sp.]